MSTAANNITISATQTLEVAKTNRILDVQALVLCRDETMALRLARALFDLGISSRLFQEAEAALEALRENRFGLVVVDCDGAEGGMALLHLVRRTASNKTATILALVNQRTRMQAAFQLGATLALQKPFSVSLLHLVLRASQGNILREQRRALRHPVEIPVSVSIDHGRDQDIIAINLSEHGMALQARHPLPANHFVRVRFDLPGAGSSVEIDGRVAWSNRNGSAGIEFVHVERFERQLVEKWAQSQFEQLLMSQKREGATLVPQRATGSNKALLPVAPSVPSFLGNGFGCGQEKRKP